MKRAQCHSLPEDIGATVVHMVSAPPNVTLAEAPILPTST
jgi:NADP-dependent 3-hydroxy acid dehydrogenase YdfG